MKRSAVVLVALSLAGGPSNLVAQEVTRDYEPRYELPGTGSEVLFVFISTSTCVGNGADRLDDAIRGAKAALKDRFEGRDQAFFAVGATPEWSVEDGIDYLIRGAAPGFDAMDFGPWDEVQAGRNWLNNGAVDYIWREVPGRPIVPQGVVIERPVTVEREGIEIGDARLLARAQGGDGIVEWFDRGMPLEQR